MQLTRLWRNQVWRDAARQFSQARDVGPISCHPLLEVAAVTPAGSTARASRGSLWIPRTPWTTPAKLTQPVAARCIGTVGTRSVALRLRPLSDQPCFDAIFFRFSRSSVFYDQSCHRFGLQSYGYQRRYQHVQASPDGSKHSGGWDSFTGSAVIGCLLTNGFLLKMVWDAYNDFQAVPSYHDTTFREYMSYRFIHWFGESKVAPPLVLTVVVQWLCLTSAVAYSFAGGGLQLGVLRSWGWLLSPDGGVQESAVSGRIVGALTSLGGVVVFALLVSMITEGFHKAMESMKDSQDPIVESGHTVMMDWTDKSPTLVHELTLAAESEGGTCIAVLDPRPLEEVRKLVEADIEHIDMLGSRIVVRTGWFFHRDDVRKVGVQSAKSVIIQSDPSVSKAESDGVAVQKLLALRSYGWPEDGSIIVHAASSTSKTLFHSVSGERVCIVDSSMIAARIMVKSTRYPEISRVYEQSLGFEGVEIYLQQWDALTGYTFQEVLFMFEDAVPIGVMTADGHLMVCPTASYRIKSDDQIIVYAEDDASYQPAVKHAMDYDKWLREHPLTAKPGAECEHTAQHCLIIGWNSHIEVLLSELGDFCAPGSSFTVLSQRPVAERKSQLRSFDEHMKTTCISSLKINHVVGSPAEQRDLEKLRLASYDSIYVLADAESGSEGAHWLRPARISADARTVTSLLLIKHILDDSGVAVQPNIVAELLESDMAGMMKLAGVKDYVDTNQVVSRLLAQASEDPQVKIVNEMLTQPGNGGIRIRALSHYLPRGAAVPESMSFWEVMCMVRRASSDICVGWLTDMQGDDGKKDACWILNPEEKHASVPWTADNLIIVVSGLEQDREQWTLEIFSKCRWALRARSNLGPSSEQTWQRVMMPTGHGKELPMTQFIERSGDLTSMIEDLRKGISEDESKQRSKASLHILPSAIRRLQEGVADEQSAFFRQPSDLPSAFSRQHTDLSTDAFSRLVSESSAKAFSRQNSNLNAQEDASTKYDGAP